MKMILSGGKLGTQIASSDRFIGSVHTTLDLEPNEEYILFLPVRFAWNSIAIQPVGSASFSISQSISEPEAIADATAHWLLLQEAQGMTTELFYFWEHPIKAFKIEGSGRINLDLASKQE